MQGQGGKQLYAGPLDAVSKLYKEGGIRSVYRGTGATLARDGPGSAASVFLPLFSRRATTCAQQNKCLTVWCPQIRYFVAYELIKEALTPAGTDPASLSLSAIVVAGGFAGQSQSHYFSPVICKDTEASTGR